MRARSQSYAIGTWVEVNKDDFSTIWHKWDDADQADVPRMDAVLSNAIPLTLGSLGCQATIQFTGPTTRPEIALIDPACSLFDEQSMGITMHRAGEYSGLVPKS